MSDLLNANDEEDAANRLIDALPISSLFEKGRQKLMMALRIAKDKERPEEGLKLTEEVLSQAKQDGHITLTFFAQRQYIREAQRLGRYDETVAMATECLESAKTYFGDSSRQKYEALEMFATACGMTGRFDESRRAFDELLASTTRVLGREHETTRVYFQHRALLLHNMVFKARDLVLNDDLANGARYLDAVLMESKTRDLFDAKDPNVKSNCGSMAAAAIVLGVIGRIQESAEVSRLCIKSARERRDLDSKLLQQCMLNYAKVHGSIREGKQVLDELLAIQIRLYGHDAPPTQATANFFSNLSQM